MIKENILLVGCGKMGSALLSGLLPNLKTSEQILVVNPTIDKVKKQFDVKVISSLKNKGDLDGFKPDIVIFAVKPQIASDVMPFMSDIVSDKTLFISVLAGKKISFFEEYLNKDAVNSETANVVRAMPNLPCFIKQGVTGAFANDIGEEYKSKVSEIFSFVGDLLWLDSEDQMDGLTAISGSGPAYIFSFAENLIDSALKLGLPENLAKALVYQTILGSAQMLKDSDKDATQLKEQVRSPKGTTDAALQVLDVQMQPLLNEATKAAYDRSKELFSS